MQGFYRRNCYESVPRCCVEYLDENPAGRLPVRPTFFRRKLRESEDSEERRRPNAQIPLRSFTFDCVFTEIWMAAAAIARRRGWMAAAVIARRRDWMALASSSNQVREISELAKSNGNGKRAFLVDTLALVRRLEAEGVPSKQAEAITLAITEVLNNSLENVSQSFVSNGRMQMSEMTQDANLTKFKSEVQSSQEHHFSLQQRETEKLKGDIEKMRSELRYEVDKVTAGQRLDLNLERGRSRDELAKQSAETSDLTNKLDREIHALKAQLEAAKYDVIKYCIGTVFSVSAVGLAVIRILM